jgi:hypothetical protein
VIIFSQAPIGGKGAQLPLRTGTVAVSTPVIGCFQDGLLTSRPRVINQDIRTAEFTYNGGQEFRWHQLIEITFVVLI